VIHLQGRVIELETLAKHVLERPTHGMAIVLGAD
jgi:hypothetical protein